MEDLKSLEAFVLAAWVWLITHFPLMCHTLYNVMLVVTQILTGVLVVCRVIHALPAASETLARWLERR